MPSRRCRVRSEPSLACRAAFALPLSLHQILLLLPQRKCAGYPVTFRPALICGTTPFRSTPHFFEGPPDVLWHLYWTAYLSSTAVLYGATLRCGTTAQLLRMMYSCASRVGLSELRGSRLLVNSTERGRLQLVLADHLDSNFIILHNSQ